MKTPDRIWAWLFHESAIIDEMQGGWTDKPDKREVEYIRSDLVVNEWNVAIEAAADLIDARHRGNLPAHIKSADGDAILALLKGVQHD